MDRAIHKVTADAAVAHMLGRRNVGVWLQIPTATLARLFFKGEGPSFFSPNLETASRAPTSPRIMLARLLVEGLTSDPLPTIEL